MAKPYIGKAVEAEKAMINDEPLMAAQLYTEAYQLGVIELEYSRSNVDKKIILGDLEFYHRQVRTLLPEREKLPEYDEGNSRNSKRKKQVESDKKFENKEYSTTFSDIAGMKDVKQALTEKIIWPLVHADKVERFGIQNNKSGVILYGPPGCGKTYIAESVVGEAAKQSGLEIAFLIGESKEFIDKYVGESQKIISAYFQQLYESAPAIGFIDEIEEVGGKRAGSRSEYRKEIVNSFLKGMNAIDGRQVLVVGATNLPWELDSALIRSGRFDTKIFVPAPDFYARARTFELNLKKMPTQKVDTKQLAEATDAYSNADIKQVCIDAANIALKQNLHGQRNYEAITQQDLLLAVESRGSSLLTWAYETMGAMLNNSKKDPTLKKGVSAEFLPMLKEAVRIRDTLETRLE